jgi:hypothetical protein
MQGAKQQAVSVVRAALTAAWKLRVRVGRDVELPGRDVRVGVVLLSYNREANLDPILRSVLRCRFVDCVLVSNNHPDKRCRDFISTDDPRVTCIDQPQRERPGIRWRLARDQMADCPVVVAVDDDVFLYPSQIRALVEAVLDDPDRVHGFAGMDGHTYLSGEDRDVDHIVRVYATTQDHIARYFELIDRMPDHGGEVERIGDDMVISLSAPGPPRMHDVGYVLSCRTSTEDGIAVNREDDFTSVRDLIFAEATAHRAR